MATSTAAAPAPSQNWMSRLWTRISNLDLNPETAFKKAIPPPCPRSVYFGEPLPEDAFDHKGRPKKQWTFATNQVLTAKYTIYNFIFKNLLEQFRRVANIFFLIVVILQFFPQFATISPGLAMLPLLVVLAITALKDGYEDVKRHQSDRFINRTKTRALIGGGWVNPNVTERKEQSVSSVWRALYGKYFGGKKRTSEKMRANLERRNSMRSQSQISMVEPIEPPSNVPQTINEGEEGGLQPPRPEFSGLNRQTTNQTTGGRSLTRTGTGHSAFDSEYETNADGRLMHQGRFLTPEEEAKYHQKKAPRWREKNWEDLSVGDFVYLKNNEPIPADIVICATSEEEDSCFIETKNLDGETNLKSRHAVPELAPVLRTPLDCSRAEIRVDVEPRDTNMYRLNASVVLSDKFDRNGDPLRCPVTLNEILLRGCNLRNTEWVIGIVLMTGYDTKIIANSGNTPSKRGKVEKLMNPMVYFNLFLLASMAIGCAIADSRIEHYFFDRGAYWQYDAVHSDDNPNINGLVSFGNALITFQNIVPISLYISIEFVRTVQAYFIFDDHDIFYEKTGRRTTARSWNLSDDLGQIQYIFSDKTGTLTQNLMIYRECCVSGQVYSGEGSGDRMAQETTPTEKANSLSDSDRSHNKLKDDLEPGRKRTKGSNEGVAPFSDLSISASIKEPNSNQGKALGRFFRCLALCHTVLTAEDENGILEYKAQSPDEQALVQAAADVGFVFCGKEKSTLRIQCPESLELESYELLTVLEFSSARKRMSVILRRETDGQIMLLTKGADSVIFERSRSGQDDIKDQTDDALEEFANKGLRTLCLAYKDLSFEEYDDWAHRYHEASVSLDQREEKMEDLASSLERDLILLGATAIEDRLQDGVPETIADLKRAGINVWVATGDKLETAIAIGYSTLLLSKEMNLVVVRGGEYGQPNSAYDQLRKAVERFFGGNEALYGMENQPPSDIDQDVNQDGRTSMHGRRSTASQASLVGEDNGQRPGGYALVIDGSALGHALSEEFSKELLLHISTRCKSVICCRVSPLQKALIVRLIKDGLGVMTLAIGDGANDVSMIQAAHVGIGIAGEEGLQAVNSSDYAIAQFRYLKRLLLVHGHWSYYRNGNMIINFFYKEIINIGYLFWFQIFCAWSTAQAIDYVYLLFWNAFWTVAAVIGMGIFDRNVSDRVLMEVPELYKRGREGKYFGLQPFLWYVLDGTYQSVVLYFFTMYTYDMTTARNDGYDINLYEWTTTMAIASVLIANLFTGLETRAWTWWIFAAVWLGPVLIFIFAPIYAAFGPSFIWTYSYGNNHYLYYSMAFWLAGILCFVLCLLPRYVFKHVRTIYYPTDIDIVRIVDKFDPKHDYIHDPRMPAMRAAQEYGTELPSINVNNDEEGLNPPNRTNLAMHDLHPISSRASSTHYDMLTGRETPNRGYTFSGEDHPPSRNHKRKLTLKDRLFPNSLKRKNKKEKKLSMIVARLEEDGEEGGENQTTEMRESNQDGNAATTINTGKSTEEDSTAHDNFRETR